MTRRTAVYGVIGAVACVGVLWGGLRLYLESSHARALAAEKFSTAIGLPVEVEELSVGSSETTAKVRIMAPANPSGQAATEVLHIQSIKADVSLTDLISGRVQPKEVTVTGLVLALTMDRDGKLLTAMPRPAKTDGELKPLPRVRIEDAAITIHQEGRPDFTLHQISLTGEQKEKSYQLEGKIQDPSWSDWTLQGTFDPQTKSGHAELAAADAPLTMDLLRSIPAVPEVTWRHLHADGRTAAKIRVDVKDAVSYSVTLTPAGRANLTSPDADATIANITGTIAISGAKVKIDHCDGQLAGGKVNVNGLLDFEPATSNLKFDVTAQGLDIKKLPAEWKLPSQFSGQLRGKANLELLVSPDGKIEPRGNGAGTIDNAMIAGLPAEVKLRLRSDGKRYRFESDPENKTSQSDTLDLGAMLTALREHVSSGEPRMLTQSREHGTRNGLHPVVFLLQPPPAPNSKPPAESTLDAAITLRDVDIAQVLTQFDVVLPYKLAGKVTVKVTASVPVGDAVDRTAYRFHGTITSPSFRFEEMEVRDVSADLTYRDGMLTLTALKATFPEVGKLLGTAKAQIEPRGDLTASLDLTDIPIGEIVKAIPGVTVDVHGPVSGHAEIKVPVNEIKDPATWHGSATLTAAKLTAAGGTIEKLSVKAIVDAGVIKLTEAKAEAWNGTINGSADVPLKSDKPGKLAVEFKELDTAMALKLMPKFPVPLTGRVTGHVNATAAATKPSEPRAITADIDINAPKMTVRGIPADKLTGKVAISRGVAEYTLEGRSLGGTFEVKGRYPADPAATDQGRLHLRNLDLGRLASTIRAPMAEPLRGLVNVNFDYNNDGSAGSGRVSVENLKWGNTSLSRDLTGSLQLHNGVVDLRDFGGRFAGGRLQTRARYDLEDPRRNFYNLAIDHASSKRLGTLVPGGLDLGDSDLSLSVRGRLGGQAASNVTLSVATATLAGIPVTNLDLPIQLSGDLNSGTIAIRNGVARMEQGIINAGVSYTYGSSSRLGGTIKFTDVRLRKIIGSSSFVGNGKITGRFDLVGNSVRSANDIGGTLTATLNQTSVREVPLLSVVTPYLSPAGLVQPFDAGEIKGRLANGIFRIERFALSNASAQIFASGSVTLTGRVDLNVIAVTGQVGPNVRALKLLGLQLPAVGPLPLTVITRVSDLLSNRMIRLTITGTTAAPVVQINKAALLTDTAVRFFVGQYIVPETLLGLP